jgi:ribosomal-protein-alanine N-acetyltransferase
MRQMMLADIDAVFAIEQAVQAYPWTRGNFSDSLAGGHLCFVDGAEGEIRGYVILMPAVDEAELLNIGVAAAHQRKGMGRKLLQEVLELVREKNMRRVFLEVRPSNTAAVALYRSAGFAEVGVRRGYYQNLNGIEDALVMAHELAGDENG